MNVLLLIGIIILFFIIAVQSWKIVDATAIIGNRTPLIEEKFMYYFFGIPSFIGIIWLIYSVLPM